MKVKVISEFIDKHTSKLHEVGEVFECDEKRFKEINHAQLGLVKIVNDGKVDEPEKEQKPARKKKGE